MAEENGLTQEKSSATTDEIVDSLQSKLTFNQISPITFSVPTDVTLKLPDGSIDAHRMILAAVSPVFERMFYGDFKEGKSRTADMPTDSYKVIKLLVDLVYSGGCKPDSLDDILPLNEVMNRYQMKKGAFYHMCGEVVLAKLDASNYLTLLPKFVSVLNKESINRAVDKVMCYTNCSFVDKFDETKNLPEEILLPLLQRNDIPNPEIDIFDYLIKWHEYQTKELKNTLNFVQKLFQCIRYFLINPHILLTKVAVCPLVDQHTLSGAIDYIYQKPLKPDDIYSKCKCGECNPPSTDTYDHGRFRCTIRLCTYWNTKPIADQIWAYISDNEYELQFNGNNKILTQSQFLKNGAYVFRLKYTINRYNSLILLLSVTDSNYNQFLYVPINTNDLIVMLVYNDDICFKVTDGARKVSVYNATRIGPFTVNLTGMMGTTVTFSGKM